MFLVTFQRHLIYACTKLKFTTGRSFFSVQFHAQSTEVQDRANTVPKTHFSFSNY